MLNKPYVAQKYLSILNLENNVAEIACDENGFSSVIS